MPRSSPRSRSASTRRSRTGSRSGPRRRSSIAPSRAPMPSSTGCAAGRWTCSGTRRGSTPASGAGPTSASGRSRISPGAERDREQLAARLAGFEGELADATTRATSANEAAAAGAAGPGDARDRDRRDGRGAPPVRGGALQRQRSHRCSRRPRVAARGPRRRASAPSCAGARRTRASCPASAACSSICSAPTWSVRTPWRRRSATSPRRSWWRRWRRRSRAPSTCRRRAAAAPRSCRWRPSPARPRPSPRA